MQNSLTNFTNILSFLVKFFLISCQLGSKQIVNMIFYAKLHLMQRYPPEEIIYMINVLNKNWCNNCWFYFLQLVWKCLHIVRIKFNNSPDNHIYLRCCRRSHRMSCPSIWASAGGCNHSITNTARGHCPTSTGDYIQYINIYSYQLSLFNSQI